VIPALEVDLDVDLSQFAIQLREIGIPHRIAEEGNRQVVFVHHAAHVEHISVLYRAYLDNALPEVVQANTRRGVSFNPRTMLRQFPLTLAIIFISIVFYPVTLGLVEGQITVLFLAMSFVPFELNGQEVYFSDLSETLASGEYWRLLTPMFLHFGWLHITFNLLWVWEVGRRIELVNGASVLLLVTLVSSLLANVTQYVMSGPSFFGGMSGVVFGYIGYSLLWSRLVPARSMGLRSGLYVFMFIYLIVGFSGAIDLLGIGSLANGAHLGGLIGGVLVGLVSGLLHRAPSQQ
jgi:GlpG protein